jgi:hypothetical protein
MKTTLIYIHVSIAGDYYQVLFEEKKDNGSSEITDDPYFLIQCQFEMYDGGEMYIESHDENYIGHYLIREAILQKNKIELELERPKYSKVEINFKATDSEFDELSNALITMIGKEKLKIITSH